MPSKAAALAQVQQHRLLRVHSVEVHCLAVVAAARVVLTRQRPQSLQVVRVGQAVRMSRAAVVRSVQTVPRLRPVLPVRMLTLRTWAAAVAAVAQQSQRLRLVVLAARVVSAAAVAAVAAWARTPASVAQAVLVASDT